MGGSAYARVAAAAAARPLSVSARPRLPPPSPSPTTAVPAFTPHAFHTQLASVAPHLPSLLAALSRARAARLPLLPVTRALAASALLRHGRLPDALAHFSHLPDSDPTAPLPAPLCNSLLAALASSAGSLVHARKVLDRMLARAVDLDTVGFGVFVKAAGRKDDGLAEVLRLVDVVGCQGRQVNRSVVVAMVVDGMCREGRIEDAWRALEEMRLRGWKPDFVAYRIVAEGFRVAGRVEEEGRILKQKRKLGVAPRKDEYRECVLVLVSNRLVTEAKEMAEAVVLGDFPIDDDVLNILVGSVSEIDADGAIMFCKFMMEKERFPSNEMLVHLCESLCKSGKGDKMWEIFRALLDKGYCRNARDYHLVVSFLGKAGKVREAYGVLKEMKKKRLEPDISSYNSLMEALCRNDLLRPAKKLWDEMFTSGCSPNLQTYNILITKFTEMDESEEVQHLFDHMFQKGVAPDGATYTSFINMLCQENKYERALEIFKKSWTQDAGVASSVLSSFILALCEQGNFKAALIVMCNVPSNVENLNSHIILLKYLTDVGEVEMAIEHLKWIRSNCSSSFENVMNELMASLATSASLQHVTKLIQYLHSQRLVDDADPWMRQSRLTALLDRKDLYFSVYAYHKMARLQKALESVQCNHAVLCTRKKYHPTRIITLTYQPFVLATTAIFTYHEAKVNTRVRNLAGYMLFFLSSFGVIILDVLSSGSGGIAPFAGVCIIAAAFGVADGHVQGGMTGDLSLMCPEFVQSFFAGMAASGAMTTALRFFTEAAFENSRDGLRKGAKATSEGSQAVTADLAVGGIKSLPNPLVEEDRVVERLNNKQLLHQNMDYALDMFLIYVLTLSIFPGFLAEDTGSHSLGSLYVLVLIASFNVSDLIGRYLPLIELIKLTSRTGLLIAVISRFLLAPAFYFTAKYGDQGWMITLTSLLGLSNGHLSVRVLNSSISRGSNNLEHREF